MNELIHVNYSLQINIDIHPSLTLHSRTSRRLVLGSCFVLAINYVQWNDNAGSDVETLKMIFRHFVGKIS